MLSGIFTRRTVFSIVLLTILLSTAMLYGLSQARTVTRSGALPDWGVSELALRAKAVVVGTVVDKLPSQKFVDSHGDPIIYIEWVVEVQRRVKGEVADQVTVRTLGGRIGRTEMVAEDEPALQVGERVLLFLRQDQYGAIRVLGGPLGKYRVEPEGGKDMAWQEFRQTVEPLDDLIRRVEQGEAGGL